MGKVHISSYQSSVEYKVVALRECPLEHELLICDNPPKAVEYWRKYIEPSPQFNPECECVVALFLNTRMKVKGHQIISIGLLNQILIHPREVFRGAIIAASFAVVMIHNHPSGDPGPSMEDIRATRDLARAGKLLKIELFDHIIVGEDKHMSLRELGYLSE